MTDSQEHSPSVESGADPDAFLDSVAKAILAVRAKGLSRSLWARRAAATALLMLEGHPSIRSLQAPVVAGWRVVPEEPTSEMLNAYPTVVFGGAFASRADIYRAMISAAPLPPLLVGGEEGQRGDSSADLPRASSSSSPSQEGARPPSEFLTIHIPHPKWGEVTVEAFTDASAQQDAFLKARETGWYADIVGIYRHHGKGRLDGKWWGGPWLGYAKRHELAIAHDQQSIHGAGSTAPPTRGEIRVIGGKRCRFIESELEGDKWEVLDDPSPIASGTQHDDGEGKP